MKDAIWHWGTTERDRELSFACDRYVPEPRYMAYRGIDIQAPAGVVFRWLCQLRVAPYSYDMIDNYGRRSPQEWIPGLQRLYVGQRFMRMFELVEFERDRQLTLNMGRRPPWLWGYIACTYLLVPGDDSGSCRLLCKVTVHREPGIHGKWRLVTKTMEAIMMRRQFLNFKQLAEATPDSGHADG